MVTTHELARLLLDGPDIRMVELISAMTEELNSLKADAQIKAYPCVLSTSLEDLRIKTYQIESLRSSGIETLKDAVEVGEAKLLRVRGVGYKAVTVIKTVLLDGGIRLTRAGTNPQRRLMSQFGPL